MIRFLIYLLLLYLVLRFVFRLFSFGVPKKVFHYEQHTHYHNDDAEQQKSSEKKPSGKNSQIGEYVDYEEIK
jgi:hypothetical protein